MTDLFDLPALANRLQVQVDIGSAVEARRIAQAWLASATRLDTWPDPVPEDLRAAALDLASLVYDNPSWLESEEVNGTVSRWALSRRAEVLAAMRERYGAGLGAPVGSFPTPTTWPDQAGPHVREWWAE